MCMRPLEGCRCARCGETLVGPDQPVNQQGETLCGLCRQAEPVFAKAAAYGSYSGGLRDLIHLLKYEHVRPAANVLGRMLAEVIEGLAPHFEGAIPVVVPVPLHPSKSRERGFNQVELFTRAALKLRPAGLELVVRSGVLERTRPTASQTGLTLNQRRENMRGAFAMLRPGLIRDCEVLLIDDVMTTGTTAAECSRVLRRAGAKRVWVATVARTLKHEATFAVQKTSGGKEDEVPSAMAAHG